MFKFFSSQTNNLPSQPNQAIAQQWEIKHLINNNAFAHNITEPDADLNIDKTVFKMRSLHIASLILPNDFTKPVEELVIARYPNGIITALIIARTGVSEQIHEAVRKKNIGAIWLTDFTHDQRKRIGLTTTCEVEHEMRRMFKFIEVVDDLATLSPMVRDYIAQVFDPSNHEVKVNPALPYFYEKFPPYFECSLGVGAWMGYKGGDCSRYNPYSDAIIPDTTPELHLAILNNDFLKVEHIVTNNPYSILERDEKGFTAYYLVAHWGSLKTFGLILDAMAKVFPSGNAILENYAYILAHPEMYWQQLKDKKLYYSYPKQKRDFLHQACISGNSSYVKEVLTKDRTRIDECDFLGFTPLLLAAANGHAELVKWLIESGASINNVMFTNEREDVIENYSLIDNAANAAVMEKILHYYVDPNETNNRLAEAIKQNDYAMAKVLIFYISRLPTDRVGLTPLDIAIKYTTPDNKEILKLLLANWENYVPYGPYDQDIPEIVQNILYKHNKKMHKKFEARKKRPVIKQPMTLTSNGPILETTLELTSDIHIISTIKPKSALSISEYEQCEALFNTCFVMRENHSPAKQKEYLYKLLHKNAHNKSYIDLCKVNGKIISFLAFEIIESEHPSIGKFLLFHGQLGATSHVYREMNLANLAFRVPIVLPQDIPVIVFVKAIQPGFGACLLPRPIKFFPKFNYSQSLMEHIVALTGEKLENNIIKAKLKVIGRPEIHFNLQLKEYQHLIGQDDENAMAIAFKVNPHVIKAYLEQLKFHGVTEKNLMEFKELWKDFAKQKISPSFGAKL